MKQNPLKTPRRVFEQSLTSLINFPVFNPIGNVFPRKSIENHDKTNIIPRTFSSMLNDSQIYPPLISSRWKVNIYSANQLI